MTPEKRSQIGEGSWDDAAALERVPTRAEINAIETFSVEESRLKDAADRLRNLAVYRDADGCWYAANGGPTHKLLTAWNESTDQDDKEGGVAG